MRAFLLRYAVWFAVGWMLISGALYVTKTNGRADAAGSLVQKTRAYQQDAERYDLVFVGDSRTYCAIHPDLLDPVLGTRSINLAHWANWFPTQYAQIDDLIEDLPVGATLVWSIGHQNFRPIHEQVHTAYPVGLSRLPGYLTMGYTAGSLRDNLVFFNPATTLLGWMPQLRQRLDGALMKELWRSEIPNGELRATQAGQASTADVRATIASLREDPLTAELEILTESGRVTSLAVSKTNGAYERIEIDQAFFRDKQRENAADVRRNLEDHPDNFDPAPEYWNSFLAILDLCQDRNVRLIVNEIEEAPYVYLTTERRERWRRFMHENVAPEVVRRGFPYLRADFDLLTDDDYFDFNHLNQDGIRTYTDLLAALLASHLELSPDATGGAL
jgi:hypothetical protein